MAIIPRGPAPYGFRWKAGRLEIEPAEAEIRKLVFALFIELKSKGAVARRLNELGHRTRRGSRWSDVQMSRILTCPSAIGHYTFNKTRTGAGGRVATDVGDQSPVVCQSIVSMTLWKEAQALVSEKPLSAPEPVHPFSGIVFCACGEKMRVPANSAKYVCPACQNKIPIIDLESLFLDELTELVDARRDFLSPLIDNPVQIEISRKVAEAEREVETAQAERQKVEEAYFASAISTERFGKLHGPFDTRVAKAKATLNHLQKKRLRLGSPTATKTIANARALLAKTWKNLSPQHRRRLVESLFDRLTIGDGEIEISSWFVPPSSKDVASAQQIKAPTNQTTPAITTDGPVYIRLPKPGQTCDLTGLTRAKLNELILPNERNNFRPPVKSISLRKTGQTRGVRLIIRESLVAYLKDQEA